MSLNKHKLLGSRVIAKRFEFPKQTEAGIILPTHISNEKKAVGTMLETLKYQYRAEVINVGSDCKYVKVGDIIFFTPNTFVELSDNPSDLTQFTDLITGGMNSPHILIDEYAVVYIEDKGDNMTTTV